MVDDNIINKIDEEINKVTTKNEPEINIEEIVEKVSKKYDSKMEEFSKSYEEKIKAMEEDYNAKLQEAQKNYDEKLKKELESSSGRKSVNAVPDTINENQIDPSEEYRKLSNDQKAAKDQAYFDKILNGHREYM